jgi:hypothetical protein
MAIMFSNLGFISKEEAVAEATADIALIKSFEL